MDLVLEVAPQLATDVFVPLLNGVCATWQAAEHKFRNVVIVLNRQFGPLCRSGRSNTQSSAGVIDSPRKMRWILCENSFCNKCRKLPESIEYPVDFLCLEI